MLIPAGLLDADPWARPSAHIHVASEARWYPITDASRSSRSSTSLTKATLSTARAEERCQWPLRSSRCIRDDGGALEPLIERCGRRRIQRCGGGAPGAR